MSEVEARSAQPQPQSQSQPQTQPQPQPVPWLRVPSGWFDRLVGADPGFNRFRGAAHCVLTIGAILVAEAIFVRFTHALQLRPSGAGSLAKVGMVNHETLVIAMLFGAIIGMLSTFGVMDTSARGQLVTMLLLPVPMVAALALGIVVGDERVVALALLAVVLAVGTYCRRFGPRGFLAGQLLFMGFFFGFFLHGFITIGDLGWLVAEICVGLLTAMVVRFAFFYPRPAKALRRTQRSYGARARHVAESALALFDDPAHDARQERRLHGQLVRLNEAALMIDAQLGDPGAVADGSSGQRLHQRLFDVELALTNVARFAQSMAGLALPADQRAEVRGALVAIVRRDAASARRHARDLLDLLHDHRGPHGTDGGDSTDVVIPHRFGGSVLALADAWTEWLAIGATDEHEGSFQPSVALFGGWLPGSAEVSAAASKESGAAGIDRIRLAPYTRTAIQMGVAVAAAVVVGDLLSGRRFYWAVIAAFITFMGVHNSGEQTRKALYRVAGTVIGIGLGSLLVDAVGHDVYWSIAVVLASLFFGFYLMRINYTFMVVGITVMVAQLYVQLDEFSNSLLLLRLEETALGAAVAVAVVMLVLPLDTRRVLRIALRDHATAIGELADHAIGHLLGLSPGTLRADARAVDASYQALVATAQPLRRNLFGSPDEATGRALRLASASRNYGRNLVMDVGGAGALDYQTRRDLELARATFRRSVAVVVAALTGPGDGCYTRSSAMLDRAELRMQEAGGAATTATGAAATATGGLAVRDLKLLDATMARMAETMGLRVVDHDTAAADTAAAGTEVAAGTVAAAQADDDAAAASRAS